MSAPAVFANIEDLRAEHSSFPVVLVPTMGNLHAGHLSLIKQARQLAGRAGKVCVSIFVNPLQFEQPQDLAAYPRTLQDDIAALAGLADTVYAPDKNQIYPERQQILVSAPGFDNVLEGEQRPGHFVGVLTVVAKLLGMIGPEIAVFGRKDYQQLVLVRMMCRQLGLKTRIEEAPVVRNAEGLALSSRNARLNDAQQKQACAIYQSLRSAADEIAGGADPGATVRQAEDRINAAGLQAGYVRCLVEGSIEEASAPVGDNWVLVTAARLAGVRLIDCVSRGD